jgi:hypothetical protein
MRFCTATKVHLLCRHEIRWILSRGLLAALIEGDNLMLIDTLAEFDELERELMGRRQAEKQVLVYVAIWSL